MGIAKRLHTDMIERRMTRAQAEQICDRVFGSSKLMHDMTKKILRDIQRPRHERQAQMTL